MPSRHGPTVGFLESDFEIGFHLIDLTDLFPSDASRLIADAEGVYKDVLARLKDLPAEDVGSFEPLVGELRRKIDSAKNRVSMSGTGIA